MIFSTPHALVIEEILMHLGLPAALNVGCVAAAAPPLVML